MKLIRYCRVALDSILINKMRSILTMLGIIIGVAAVLSTVGIGQGATAQITKQVQSQGTNLLTVTAGASNVGGVNGGSGSAGTLTMGDATALADQTFHPAVGVVAPAYNGNAQLINGSTNSQNQVVGTTPSYQTIHNLEVASGRFLSEDDVVQDSQVVVLGAIGGDRPVR